MMDRNRCTLTTPEGRLASLKAHGDQMRDLGWTLDHGPAVHCAECHRLLRHALTSYRCFFCKLFFCSGCAPAHFGGDNVLDRKYHPTKNPVKFNGGKSVHHAKVVLDAK